MAAHLWTFSGLDGSGKSTQIDLLAQHLQHEGHAVKRLWIRGGYTPVFESGKTLVRRLRPRALPPPGPSSARTRRFASPVVRNIWLTIAMIDLLLVTGLWVRLLRLRGVHVIADRWLQDTGIDFEINFPESAATGSWLWKLVRSCAARPDAHFTFLIPVEESMRRSREKGEPFPDSEETLRRRFLAYEAMQAHTIPIDGCQGRDLVFARILRACVGR